MRARNRFLAILLGIAGIGLCLVGVGTFFLTIVNNTLPWYPAQTAQEHYVAVGQAYSHGFAAGFFLCFFLAMIAAVIGAWVQERRARARASGFAREARPTPAPAQGSLDPAPSR